MIAGLTSPSSGQIELSGSSVTEPSAEIGYMLQQDYLFPWLTIGKNMTIGLDVTKMKTVENKEYALDLLEQMGLLDRVDDMPHELSGGCANESHSFEH